MAKIGTENQLRQFPQVKGDSGEDELVAHATGSAQSQPVELDDPFELGKAHFDLLALSPRGCVSGGLMTFTVHMPGLCRRFVGRV